MLNWCLLVATLGVFLIGFYLLRSSHYEEGYSVRQERSQTVYPKDKIGWGPLALGGMRTLGPVPNLMRELILIGRNSRPDAKKDSALLLGLKSTAQERLVFSGDLVYLKRQPDGTFTFANQQTDLAIRPLGLEGEGALVEVMLAGREGPQRGEVTLGIASQGKLEEESYWKAIRAAEAWGADVFLERFGSKEYPDYLFKYQLKMDDQVFFVKEGDLLNWDDDHHWTLGERTDKEHPIGQITSVNPRGIELQVWDPTGFYSEKAFLSLKQAPRQSLKFNELITKVKPRSGSEVSCFLGKKRVVIREGDWWVKMNDSWKNLRTVTDIEDFIQHRISGELFIFDRIETDKAKVHLRGQRFDTMRTQIQPLTVTFHVDDPKGSKKSPGVHSVKMRKSKGETIGP